MNVYWTARSSNRKTGDVPTAWVGATRADTEASCSGCPLLDNGCYAHAGLPATAIASVRKGAAADPWRYTLEAALERRSRKARMMRVSALGDIGRAGLRVAYDIAHAARRAGLALVGYTHHWREPEVATAWKGRLMASCETAEQADEAGRAGWRATIIVPPGHPRSSLTPDGRRVVVCPAQLREGLTCNDCRLCDASKPGPVVAFIAHGGSAGRLPENVR